MFVNVRNNVYRIIDKINFIELLFFLWISGRFMNLSLKIFVRLVFRRLFE